MFKNEQVFFEPWTCEFFRGEFSGTIAMLTKIIDKSSSETMTLSDICDWLGIVGRPIIAKDIQIPRLKDARIVCTSLASEEPVWNIYWVY